MSDNVTLPGSGAVIATDQVTDGTLGTVQVQFMKVMDGTLDSTNKLVVDSNGAVLVTASPSASVANRSGSITSGGTAQTFAAANTARKGFLFQNTSTAPLWIDMTTTAVLGSPSVKIGTGSYFECPVGAQGQAALSVIGSTTGQTFTAKEW